MTRERQRGRRTQEDTPKSRETQPLDVGDCTCYVQRATVGEDHVKDCPLYRQRGSGVSVFTRPRAHYGVLGWSTHDEADGQGGKRRG